MVDSAVSRTWTTEYVTEHRRECLSFLQGMNTLLVRYLEKGKYMSAITTLDQLLNALEVMHNSRRYGNLAPYMSTFSFVEGSIFACVDTSVLTSEAFAMGAKTKFTPAQLERNTKECAMDCLQDAMDFARTPEMKKAIADMISAVSRSLSPSLLRMELGLSLPDWLLETLDIMYKGERGFLAFVENGYSMIAADRRGNERIPMSMPTGGEPAGGREKPAKRKIYPPEDFTSFEDWVYANGWGEEDLGNIYKRLRSRKILYAILCCSPLILFFFVFYVRSNQLMEIVRCRNLKAKERISNLMVFFAGPWLFLCLIILPLIVGMFFMPRIRRTGWGMGLQDYQPIGGTLYTPEPAPEPARTPSRKRGVGGFPWKPVLAVLCVGTVVYFLCFSAPRAFTIQHPQQALQMLLKKPSTSSGSQEPSRPPEAGVSVLTGDWFSMEYLLEGDGDSIPTRIQVCTFQEDGTYEFSDGRYVGAPGATRWTYEEPARWTGSFAQEGDRVRLTAAGGSSRGWNADGELKDGALYLTREGTGLPTVFLKCQFSTSDDRMGGGSVAINTHRRNVELNGSWSTAWRTGNTIQTAHYWFEDGFAGYQVITYLNTQYDPMEGESGWYAIPMGQPYYSGTYQYNGKTLALRLVEVNLQEQSIQAFSARKDDNGNLLLDNTIFIPDDEVMEMEEICGILNVDLS